MIHLQRAYDHTPDETWPRYLVDRLWPRGVKREDLDLVDWTKNVGPSDDLRHWFGHDPEKWVEFRKRYWAELDKNKDAWQPLLDAARHGDITLVFSAKDTEYNNAVALKEYLEKRL